MELGTLKPLLTNLAMPPLSLLLLALLGLFLAAWRKRAVLGLAWATLSLALLGLLSCHGTAVWLSRHAFTQFAPVTLAQLKAENIQAIVILGAGLLPVAPEYGQSQPASLTTARLHYGIWLAKQSGLPLAFSGGVGWASTKAQQATEAEVVARVASYDYGVTLGWLEDKSRDTAENARFLAPLLLRDGVQRIVLVTQAVNMARAVAAFKRAGMKVTPAPTGYVLPEQNDFLEWLPSAYGMISSQQVLREWLALAIGQ